MQLSSTLIRDACAIALQRLDAGDVAGARDTIAGLMALAEPERNPAPPPAPPWAWPVLGIKPRVTQRFDAPVSYGKHEGVDFDCYDDETGALCRIAACDAGVVVAVNRWDGTRKGMQAYGNWVLIQHGAHQARYCHLSALLVREGEAVARGALIGVGGNTGNSRGAHLHLTVTREDAPPAYVFGQRCVDPLALLGDPG